MNELTAKVYRIKEVDSLHIVEFDFAKKHKISMLSLELPDIRVGSEVVLSFKSTHVLVSKSKLKDISLDNQINATIKDIEIGNLLVYLLFECYEESVEVIITKDSFKEMELRKQQNLFLGINASEIFIKKVLD